MCVKWNSECLNNTIIKFIVFSSTSPPPQCAFLVWCMLPMANSGSMVIYHRLIKPFVKKHEKTLDSAVGTVTEVAQDISSKGEVAMATSLQATEFHCSALSCQLDNDITRLTLPSSLHTHTLTHCTATSAAVGFARKNIDPSAVADVISHLPQESSDKKED